MLNNSEALNKILKIDTNNEFLSYIVDRIQDEDYRGIHISQHNRYDLDRLRKIMIGIYKVVGDQYFRIPLGDDRQGYRESECEEYYKIVENINENINMVTINSLKKNFFVDFQRLGFLDRFDKNMSVISNSKRSQVYWGRLTQMAIKLIESSSLQNSYKIFTDAIDNLFGSSITQLADTIYYSKYKNDSIGIDEFMLILSDDRPGINERKIDLLTSYRSLERWQKDKAIELIREYCNPDNFAGDKTQKRDFGNWKNESQQIFSLLKNTVYFDITNNSLRLNTGRYGIFEESSVKQRSLGAKVDYFTKHNINKVANFELHHIIELSSVRNKVEFKLVDNWKNLIYLDKNKHAKLTHYNNNNKLLTATPAKVYLETLDKMYRIVAENGVSALYDGQYALQMQNYNRLILKEIFGYVDK